MSIDCLSQYVCISFLRVAVDLILKNTSAPSCMVANEVGLRAPHLATNTVAWQKHSIHPHRTWPSRQDIILKYWYVCEKGHALDRHTDSGRSLNRGHPLPRLIDRRSVTYLTLHFEVDVLPLSFDLLTFASLTLHDPRLRKEEHVYWEVFGLTKEIEGAHLQIDVHSIHTKRCHELLLKQVMDLFLAYKDINFMKSVIYYISFHSLIVRNWNFSWLRFNGSFRLNEMDFLVLSIFTGTVVTC